MADQAKLNGEDHYQSTDGEIWQTEDTSRMTSLSDGKGKRLTPLRLSKTHEEEEQSDQKQAPLPPITRSPNPGVGNPPSKLYQHHPDNSPKYDTELNISPTLNRPFTSPSTRPHFSKASAVSKPLPETSSITRPLPQTPSMTRPLHHAHSTTKPLSMRQSVTKPLPMTPSVTKPLPMTPSQIGRHLTSSQSITRPLVRAHPHITYRPPDMEVPSTTVYHSGSVKAGANRFDEEDAVDYKMYLTIRQPYRENINDSFISKGDEGTIVPNLVGSDPYINLSAEQPKAGDMLQIADDDNHDYQRIASEVLDIAEEKTPTSQEGLYEDVPEMSKEITKEKGFGDYEYPTIYSLRAMERQNSTTPLVGRQISDNPETDIKKPVVSFQPHENGDVTNGHANGHANGDANGHANGGLNSLVKKNSGKVSPTANEKDDKIALEKMDGCGDCVTSTKKKKTDSCCIKVVRIITSLLVGIWFGWMLHKSTVFKPETIRNQFLFKEFVMLKTFIGALSSSLLGFVLLSCIPSTKPHIEAARRAMTKGFTAKGVISTLCGSFILGTGMAIAGACPGMVLAQVGDLVPNSAYTILGGLLGCLCYGLVHKLLIKCTAPSEPYNTLFIYQKLKVPYAALAIPTLVLCVAGITCMEIFIPETNNDGGSHDSTPAASTMTASTMTASAINASTTTGMLTSPTVSGMSISSTAKQESISYCLDDSNWFTQEMWSPSVCGVLIGLVQIPIVLILSDSMGSSSAYMTVASQWVVCKSVKKKLPYMAGFRSGITNCWMVLYVIGTMGGAILSAASSCSFLETPGVPWWQALLGGFLMLFGSRLGSGCTSGHGISGAAMLVGVSWLAVPTMFIGGIAVAFALEYTSMNNYVEKWEPMTLTY